MINYKTLLLFLLMPVVVITSAKYCVAVRDSKSRDEKSAINIDKDLVSTSPNSKLIMSKLQTRH